MDVGVGVSEDEGVCEAVIDGLAPSESVPVIEPVTVPVFVAELVIEREVVIVGVTDGVLVIVKDEEGVCDVDTVDVLV